MGRKKKDMREKMWIYKDKEVQKDFKFFFSYFIGYLNC
jgi:hypothetical protein